MSSAKRSQVWLNWMTANRRSAPSEAEHKRQEAVSICSSNASYSETQYGLENRERVRTDTVKDQYLYQGAVRR